MRRIVTLLAQIAIAVSIRSREYELLKYEAIALDVAVTLLLALCERHTIAVFVVRIAVCSDPYAFSIENVQIPCTPS